MYPHVTQLEAYAVKLGTLSDWDGSGRGYTWEYHYLSSWFWLFLVGDILLAVFAIWLSYQMYLAWNSNKHNYVGELLNKLFNLTGSNTTNKDETMKQDRFRRVLLFSRVALIVIPCIELICNIIFAVEAVTICPNKECQQEVIPMRVMINASTIVIGIASGIFGVVDHYNKHREKSNSPGETPDSDDAGTANPLSQQESNNTVTPGPSSSQGCKAVIPGFAFLSYFITAYFFVFLSINAIPTLIAAFIFPNEIILAVLYFPMIGIILLIYAEFSYYILIVPKEENNPSKLKQPISGIIYLCHAGNFLLVLFVTTELFVFSLFVYNTELHPPAYITLLFPLILSGFTIVKKYLNVIFRE